MNDSVKPKTTQPSGCLRHSYANMRIDKMSNCRLILHIRQRSFVLVNRNLLNQSEDRLCRPKPDDA
ncbi:hypothetical protein T265_09318 [Opisthorchis viverrini]|uniref:Uncharacterized protein n=1 Tax=Opisthorchis viverrini TaxID=6198 RepID=A0A075A5J5_OPIVI|nr:hypothetical protein T265_09318 [Opisthorchis viverrini]KER22659.1 hypothetical protein T265_09318 [Opisthorchis viverrini]